MAPRLVINENQHKHNCIHIKKLKRSMMTIAKLREENFLLSNQNKELSSNRNDYLLNKLSLENENNSLNNKNIQLTAINHNILLKYNLIEQNLKKCLSSVLNLSQCIPTMMGDLHEVHKFDKLFEPQTEKKKEKLTTTVRPMINGMTINQPAVTLKRLELSPIVESPKYDDTPKRPRISSYQSSPLCKLNMEPYVRLKDVATMLKHSKVPNGNSPSRVDLGEGPSWLYNSQNPTPNSQNKKNSENHESSQNSLVLNETDSVPQNQELIVNEMGPSEISSPESNMFKNITLRKRKSRKLSESNTTIDLDNSATSSTSTNSTRSKRCNSNKVNYKEKPLKTKLRRS